ncbi:MAG: DUF1653 domain-containing protein [Clostridia bacterium]|nr:DUF1653 domain-containing protein [Clostridia bacterium]
MEIWDLYDENRRLTGETMVRGDPVPKGRYHLVLDALFLNGKGELLFQRRADEKELYPGMWAETGGSALQGEDSRTAVAREVAEELGFLPDLEHSRVMLTQWGKEKGFVRDVYLFWQDVLLSAMRFQPEEVQDARWVLPEDIYKDEKMAGDLAHISYWDQLWPYLCLESMRVRIPAGTYRHYKGNLYQVEGLSLHSETLEPMVNYRALYGMGERWVRPARMWREEITLPDGRQVRRFQIEK